MRIGICEELMPFPLMAHLTAQISRHAEVDWIHKPVHTPETIMLSEGDACQPFKSMVRTSVALLQDVDLLLIPRLINLDGHLMCPNFRALPDIIRLNVKKGCPDLEAKLVDLTVDISTDDDCKTVIASLYRIIFNTDLPVDAIAPEPQEVSILTTPQTPFAEKTIALLGHPYLLEESKLNMGIIRQLKHLGYTITTPNDIPFADLDNLAKKGDYYAKSNYWRSSRETLGAFYYYTELNKPAGIIYLISFNCGVDALMRIELMSLHNKLEEKIPFMVLVGDEHTQQEHTATRLEAYLDIIDGI